jgi:RNA polymerase sigma-70 factor (ECF subfamily)
MSQARKPAPPGRRHKAANGNDDRVEAQPDEQRLERELFGRLRRRQREALGRLVREYGPALVRAAYLYLGDRHAAEDVAQDTLIAAWDTAKRARPETKLRPWLFGILFNRCRKHRRSLGRRLRRERSAAARRQAEGDSVGHEDDSVERLGEALARLDEALRAVVILRYERGLSVAQTAEALGLPEGTVKSRTHAAIRKLRGWIGQDR